MKNDFKKEHIEMSGNQNKWSQFSAYFKRLKESIEARFKQLKERIQVRQEEEEKITEEADRLQKNLQDSVAPESESPKPTKTEIKPDLTKKQSRADIKESVQPRELLNKLKTHQKTTKIEQGSTLKKADPIPVYKTKSGKPINERTEEEMKEDAVLQKEIEAERVRKQAVLKKKADEERIRKQEASEKKAVENKIKKQEALEKKTERQRVKKQKAIEEKAEQEAEKLRKSKQVAEMKRQKELEKQQEQEDAEEIPTLNLKRLDQTSEETKRRKDMKKTTKKAQPAEVKKSERKTYREQANQQQMKQRSETEKPEAATTRKARKQKNKGFSIRFMILMSLALGIIVLLAGMVIGYGVLGDGDAFDVLRFETWKHIKNLVTTK